MKMNVARGIASPGQRVGDPAAALERSGRTANLANWFAATRPQFLLASLTCLLVGVSFARYSGHSLRTINVILTVLGGELAHVAVHALNDYSDYRTGIDAKVRRTPFSGGTGLLTSGRMRPRQMLGLGIGSLLAVLSIGLYFVLTGGLAILPIGVLGVAVIWFYTSFLARHGVGELAVGLGFCIWCVGAYVAQTGDYSLDIIAVAVLPGLSGAALLLLNEFPDFEADRAGGRRNLLITKGLAFASRVHVALVASMFAWLAAITALGILPLYSCLAFVLVPLGVVLMVSVARGYGDIFGHMNALRLNVVLDLAFPTLVGVGTIVGILR